MGARLGAEEVNEAVGWETGLTTWGVTFLAFDAGALLEAFFAMTQRTRSRRSRRYALSKFTSRSSPTNLMATGWMRCIPCWLVLLGWGQRMKQKESRIQTSIQTFPDLKLLFYYEKSTICWPWILKFGRIHIQYMYSSSNRKNEKWKMMFFLTHGKRKCIVYAEGPYCVYPVRRFQT